MFVFFRLYVLRTDCLTGAINRHKSGEPVRPTGPTYPPIRPRNNVYVNPNYKPISRTHKPPVPTATQVRPAPPPATIAQDKRDVIIDGVAFESSGRSLVRKDRKYL